MKRGQITIFILAGIAIVISVSFLLTYLPKIKENRINEQREILNNYVHSCLDSVSRESLFVLGSQGKMYLNLFLETNGGKIEYYYYEGKSFIPETEDFENNMSKYIEDNIDSCLGDFSSLKYKVEKTKPNVTAKINKEDVSVRMEYPVKLYVGENTIELSEFSQIIDIRLNHSFTFAKEILKETVKQQKAIDSDSLPSGQHLIFNTYKIDDKIVYYEVTDSVKKLKGEPYKFRFAVKLGCKGLMDFGSFENGPIIQEEKYLYYNGERITLVGYGNYIMVADPDFNYHSFMDTIKENGINMVRIWGMAQMGHPGYCAFDDSSGRFDLASYSSTYFARLKEFVEYAQSKGIVVQIDLFDSWALKGTSEPHQWQVSPYNPDNDINGVFFSPSDVCASNDINTAYIKKFAQELGNYNNVIYEVMNEPDQLAGCEEGFHNYVIDVLKNELSSYSGSKLISSNYYDVPGANIVVFHHPEENIRDLINSYNKPVMLSDDGWGYSCGDSATATQDAIEKTKETINSCGHYEHLDGSFEYGEPGNEVVRRLREPAICPESINAYKELLKD